MRFEFLGAVITWTLFWIVTPCVLIGEREREASWDNCVDDTMAVFRIICDVWMNVTVLYVGMCHTRAIDEATRQRVSLVTSVP